MEQFSRTALLLGDDAIEVLLRTRVIIFGIGGVGSFTAEALARCGTGNLTLVDGDNVSITNINRQIHALHSTIGRPKVEVMAERIKDINPHATIAGIKKFVDENNLDQILTEEYDYVVDAIDTIRSKVAIVCRSKTLGLPVISCMGAARKLEPTRFEVADLFETRICPVARIMRRELRTRGIESLKVVYSKEHPIKTCSRTQAGSVPGSVAFVPPVAGLIVAAEVIKDLLKAKNINVSNTACEKNV